MQYKEFIGAHVDLTLSHAKHWRAGALDDDTAVIDGNYNDGDDDEDSDLNEETLRVAVSKLSARLNDDRTGALRVFM